LRTSLTPPASAGTLARTLGLTKHMSSARVAFYFIGIVLLAAAAIIIGRQFGAGEPIEWQAPCIIALFGLGSVGLGIFSDLESTQNNECNDPRADGPGDLGADPD
jgi:hypothetical protein